MLTPADDSTATFLPTGARCFPLQPGKKIPATAHGHLDARLRSEVTILGNAGIALDNQWLLVDIDRPCDEATAFEQRLPATWTQVTGRGTHYLYRVPEAWTGRNTRAGTPPFADLKCHGYLVAPGSVVTQPDGRSHTYACTNAVEPADAPPWLLAMLAAPTTPVDAPAEAAREHIPLGQNDVALTQIAGALRRFGYGPSFIGGALAGLFKMGLVEQDETRPYTGADIARIARSAAAWEVGGVADGLTLTTLQPVVGNDLVRVPVSWWVHGFIPRAHLVMLYGSKSRGKSTFGAWTAVEVTRKGGRFFYVGTEEAWQTFMFKAVLGGAVRERLFFHPDPRRLVLPGGLDTLLATLERDDVVYFDSIYTHFATMKDADAAARARATLEPLAHAAQQLGITFIGCFHSNKAGQFLGSVEMVNVARHVLYVTRRGDGPTRVYVRWSNLLDPGYALTFTVNEMDGRDPANGAVQYEEGEDGALAVQRIRVAVRGENVETHGMDAEAAEQEAAQPAAVMVDQLERPNVHRTF